MKYSCVSAGNSCRRDNRVSMVQDGPSRRNSRSSTDKPGTPSTARRTMSSRCCAPTCGLARCGGTAPGIRRTSSSPQLSSTSMALRRWPMCTGSKVPPRMPIFLATNVSVAKHHVFFAGQPQQSDRATGMQLVGGNADFRAQTVLETIGKTGRGVDHHRTGVHFGQEAACSGEVFGNDAVGMLRAMPVDMGNGLVDRIKNAYGQNGRVVFFSPVLFAGGNHLPGKLLQAAWTAA